MGCNGRTDTRRLCYMQVEYGQGALDGCKVSVGFQTMQMENRQIPDAEALVSANAFNRYRPNEKSRRQHRWPALP